MFHRNTTRITGVLGRGDEGFGESLRRQQRLMLESLRDLDENHKEGDLRQTLNICVDLDLGKTFYLVAFNDFNRSPLDLPQPQTPSAFTDQSTCPGPLIQSHISCSGLVSCQPI